MFYGFPKSLRVNRIIAMYKDMAHALYLTPVNITMRSPEIVRQHIYSLSDNLNKFRKAKEDKPVLAHLLKSILRPILPNAVYGIENVLKPTLVSNLLSHISETYPD